MKKYVFIITGLIIIVFSTPSKLYPQIYNKCCEIYYITKDTLQDYVPYNPYFFRKYFINDSIMVSEEFTQYIEKNIPQERFKKFDTFLIRNGNWYHKKDDKYIVLFANEKNTRDKSTRYYYSKQYMYENYLIKDDTLRYDEYIPSGRLNTDSMCLYIYIVKERYGSDRIINQYEILFNPEYGLIISMNTKLFFYNKKGKCDNLKKW